MKKTQLILGGLVAIVLGSTQAWAAPAQQDRAESLRARIDTDGNGEISQEEREKALREAAEECERVRIQKANGPMPEGACFDYEQRILALIEKDTP